MANVRDGQTWSHYIDGCKVPLFTTDEILQRLTNFKIFENDVLIAGHPRSGTNWTSELVWLIHNGGNTESILKSHSNDRSPCLEMHFFTREQPNIDYIERMQCPRVIKTHLRPQFFEKQMKDVKFKIIFVLRNPKDMLVSYYHFVKEYLKYEGSWNDFFILFTKDNLPFENVFSLVTKWWELRLNPDIMFIHYEELKTDTHGSIRKMADHLGKSLSEDQIDNIAKYATVANMKKNLSPGAEFLIRKGKVGEWCEYFSLEQEKIIDEKISHVNVDHGLFFTQGQQDRLAYKSKHK